MALSKRSTEERPQGELSVRFGSRMFEEPKSLEMFVLAHIRGAFKSREVLEAEWPEDGLPLDDDRVFLSNWASMVNRQGVALAQLSAVPSTKAELVDSLPGGVDRSPAWIKARVHGEAMTWRLFFTGLAQTVAVHRDAIERVIDEQVSDPEPTHDVLAEAPVPAAKADEERSALMSGVIRALTAHTEALADIAYDLEMTARRLLEPEDEEFEEDED